MPHARARRRGSLARRLVVGGLVLVVALVGSTAGYLLVHRVAEDRDVAQATAGDRSGLARNLLSDIVQPQARSTAELLAGFGPLQDALLSADPRTSVAALFTSGRIGGASLVSIAVMAPSGGLLYSTSPGQAAPSASLASVALATASGSDPACHHSRAAINADPALQQHCPASVSGVEMLSPDLPALDVAAPVLSGDGSSFGGVVLVSAPLGEDFLRYGAVIGYPVVFVPAAGGTTWRFPDDGAPAVAIATPPEIGAAVRSAAAGTASLPAGYQVGGVGDVQTAYVPVLDPLGMHVTGWLGAEVPVAPFAAGTAADVRGIVVIAVAALIIVSALVLVFVLRFVRRPIAELEEGVARIAGGDYAQDIGISSNDELGRLAESVNAMRRRIQTYVDDLDLSISQLQSVSRALTTTTSGVTALEDAIVKAAAVIADGCTESRLLIREEETLRAAEASDAVSLSGDAVARVLGGDTVELEETERWRSLVPMFARERVMGAIEVVTSQRLSDPDRRALEALANNGGIAIENTRLFERERDTLQRLRELDAMKSDFLSTAQHELRTPVLAIMGQLELITFAWESWDDATKLDLIREVDASTRTLSDLVETIIDFSLLSTEKANVRLAPVAVRQAVDTAVAEVRRHFKEGMPATVTVDVEDALAVEADAKRFRQVIRCLVDNAVKFAADDGHVTVRARREHERAVIDVSDDGIGISEAALPRVFERFYQEDNSKTRRHGGLGMGLALVRRLCEVQGAKLEITSTPGKGTTVHLRWPLATGEVEPAPANDAFYLSQL